MFRSYKWALLILLNVGLARIGGLLALVVTGTYLSVSSGVGMLALFGVSVQTGVIMVEYINQLRARGHSIVDAAVEGAVLRLRPIMMTMLVATLGLLPAALSHDIGSDSQRPFAIVIVGGLISDLATEHHSVAYILCLDRAGWRSTSRTGRFFRGPMKTEREMLPMKGYRSVVVAAVVLGLGLNWRSRRLRSRLRWSKPSIWR
jgi:predicted RND superfamily exporter protein